MPRPEYLVANGDVRLAVRDYGGKGPDLLMTHGAGSNLRSLGALIPLLRVRHRVVAYDIRGHGWSDETATVSASELVSDAEAIVDALGLDNPFFAGHSLGGMIAAFYGEAHPECPGVANIDGHGRGGPSVPASVRARLEELAAAATPALASAAGHGDVAWLEAELRRQREETEATGIPWSAAEGLVLRHYVVESDGLYHRRPSWRMQSIFEPVIRSWELFDLYRRISCPLLIFHCVRLIPGLEDVVREGMRTGLQADLEQLVADRPGTEVARVDATHAVVYENPSLCAQHLLDFFAR